MTDKKNNLYSILVELFVELCLGTIEILKDLYSGTFNLYKNVLMRGYRRYIRALEYSNNLSRSLFRLVQAASYIAIAVLLINLTSFYFATETTPVSFGSFGDFFGGILNPIFTFLMLISLVVTIVLQKNELSLARKEFSRTADSLHSQNQNLELQRFENTFFKLLDYYEHCRNDVQCIIMNTNITTQGRDAFKSMFEIFRDEYMSDTIMKNYGQINQPSFSIKGNCHNLDGIKDAYDKFYSDRYGEELGQYFLTIYNILKFVDRAKSIESKKLYSNLLRAQLSRYELLLLFYNVISFDKENKMKPLIMRFGIMKYLDSQYIPEQNKDLIEELKSDEKISN